jgi:hypothetical protein
VYLRLFVDAEHLNVTVASSRLHTNIADLASAR